MQTSTVKWFDAKKGYGFIEHPSGGDDIFVHYSNIISEEDFKSLDSGDRVQFEMKDGPKGLHAVEVKAIEDDDSESAGGASSSEIGPTDVDPMAETNRSIGDDGSSSESTS